MVFVVAFCGDVQPRFLFPSPLWGGIKGGGLLNVDPGSEAWTVPV